MKKGIRPIISVILMIVFAITLGLVIMGWSSGLIKKSIERSGTRIGTDLECMDVELKLELDEKATEIIIKNNGRKDLNGYLVRVIISDESVKVDKSKSNNIIDAYGAKTYNYGDYVAGLEPLIGVGSISKIEIIPKINIAEEGNEVVDCTDKTAAYTF